MKLGSALSLFSLVFSVVMSVSAQAQNYPALRQTLSKYRSAALVEMSVEKTVKSELMAKETVHKGTIFVTNGKFRWENKTPEETLLVFDGTYLWNVQYPDPDFGGSVQVAKSKLDKKNKSQLLLLDLLTKAAFFEGFNVKKLIIDGDLATYETESLAKDISVADLVLTIDTKEKVFKKLSYKDDVGNITQINFEKTTFSTTGKSQLFKYTPPKGAQVTNL